MSISCCWSVTINIIFGNFGNNTIALLRWAFEQAIAVHEVVTVDTGWQAEAWQLHVANVLAVVNDYGIRHYQLIANPSFAQQVVQRNAFPAMEHQWCSSFLKGLPFLSYLDEIDPLCEATILLGSRRYDSRARFDLPERVAESEYYGGREVWYPLYNCSDQQREQLIQQTGVAPLVGRSLECSPCLFSSSQEVKDLSKNDCNRLNKLEKIVGKAFIMPCAVASEATIENFDMGCGSRYVCGE